jgi:hypothetical protein
VPTPTETPIPKIAMVAPTPQPTRPISNGRELVSDLRFGLGNLRVNPDPVNFAGTFIEFSVNKDVDITLNVYSATTGKLARQMKGGAFRPGNNQLFFNALDDNGKVLAPGQYTYELVAEKDGHKEVRNGGFEFIKARRKK